MATSASPAKKFPFHPSQWVNWGVTLMDRYIATQLLMPFLFGVVAFTSIVVSVGVLQDLLRRVAESGLPFGIAMQIFLLKLPFFVGYAFPMSMLLSCLMVYGRLSGDSELIALRSCGVSVYRLVAPAIAVGLLVTAINFALNESFVPAANRQAEEILQQAITKSKPTFSERNIFYQEFRSVRQPNGRREDVLSRTFYAREYDGQQMKGLTIMDFSQDGLNQIVISESAVWNGEQKAWMFYNGTIYLVAPDGSYRNIVRFEQQELKLPRTPLDIAQTSRDPSEMNIAEINDYLRLIERSGNQREIRKMRLQVQQKMALPFACVAFGMVGATMGVRPQRTSRAAGFGLSLIIIVSYYFLYVSLERLYIARILDSAFLAGWLATLVALGAGLLLLFRLNR
ncbi:MAG: LptF/LptG family permease [Leptolyngbyaceae cyanobacterium bins.349]|nr:LptF/LptG family permease [Leptolyngbyaceae cyanobacterium bins.349]